MGRYRTTYHLEIAFLQHQARSVGDYYALVDLVFTANQALILHDIMAHSDTIHAGEVWLVRSLDKWTKIYNGRPSRQTIHRILRKLERGGWIIAGCYNELPLDRRRWYRPNWDKIKKL